MRLNPIAEKISDNDDVIRASMSEAMPPPLLAAVAQLTGDLSVLRSDLVFDQTKLLEPNAGYTDEQLAHARALAADALIRFRDSGATAAPAPDHATLVQLIEFATGGPVPEGFLPLLEEELALDGQDLRAPKWNRAALAPDRRFVVGIIGAGMSGLIMAHRLRQAGVEFVIFDKNADVGGTWFENVYPGCRVDIPNHFYSYACAQTADWPQFYSTQPVLHEYFASFADQFGLRPNIRCDTEVMDCVWSDDDQTWSVRTRACGQDSAGQDSPGQESTITVHALVSAVGQLNRPKMPDIVGIDTFVGPAFHSAYWDHSIDFAGQRVAVVGTGASAAQFIPIVAEQAESLTVFQRTPPWLLPVPNYQDDVPHGNRWLLRHLPAYMRWDRMWIMSRTNTGLLPLATVDPDWVPNDRSVSAANDFLREMLTMYYQVMFPDPELFVKVLPTYPPIAKRVVLDGGTLPLALNRSDVHLTIESITSIDATGINTADGVHHDADIIIYGTGFEATNFLTPMNIVGAQGTDLHERWGGDARAYLGITVPEFPNLFMMYGPNTNIVINGSIIYFSECEAHYIAESVHMLLANNHAAMNCRDDVHDQYNEYIDAGNSSMAWGVSDVNSWYKNEFGRVAQNWPYSLHEYWQQTRSPNPNDYELT